MAKCQMPLTNFMPESFKNRKLADETRSEKTAETPDKPLQSNVELSRQLSVQTQLKREQEISRRNGLGSFLCYARPTEI